MRQHCASATALAHAALHAHAWHLVHLRPLLSGLEGGSYTQHTMRLPRSCSRFAPDHVARHEPLCRRQAHPLVRLVSPG